MSIELLKDPSRFFLADGGLETWMIFEEGFDLPLFSSSALLTSEEGRDAMRRYFEPFIETAKRGGFGFVLDTATWRSGMAWSEGLGKSEAELLQSNRDAVEFAKEIRDSRQTPSLPILINGVIGPSSDGYAPDSQVTAKEARDIHGPQVRELGKAGVDFISAVTMTHAGEGAGVALAAREIDVPVVISFTLETDGRLPSGQALGDAIAEVDAATDGYPIYYMINCAHPDHFRDAVSGGEAWTKRVGAIRANASRMSHAELDNSEELDAGDPEELGALHEELLQLLPGVHVLGGCCGTDHRHVEQIAGRFHAHAA